MGSNYFDRLGLPLEAVAFSRCLMSRLIDASNFLVGTFFSASRFSFASTDDSFTDLQFDLDLQWSNKLCQLFEMVHKLIDKCMLRIPLRLNLEPYIAAVWAARYNLVKFTQRYVTSPAASRALEFNTSNISDLDNKSLFGSQFSSLTRTL